MFCEVNGQLEKKKQKKNRIALCLFVFLGIFCISLVVSFLICHFDLNIFARIQRNIVQFLFMSSSVATLFSGFSVIGRGGSRTAAKSKMESAPSWMQQQS